MRVTRKAFPTLGHGAVRVVPLLSAIFGGGAILLMSVFVIAEVITRNVFRYSLPFTVEYTEYLVPLVAFMGAAYTMRHAGHVRADILLHRFPDKTRQWFILIGYLIGFIFLIVVSIQTLDLALTAIAKGYVSYYALNTPIGYVQMIVPIGLWLWALQVLISMAEKAKILFLSYK